MAAPTTGSLNVVGSAGGMAPFPTSVYADPDEAGSTWATGSGVWSEGRWAFQLIDNATGQVYDSGLLFLDENVFLEPDWLNPAIFNGELRILDDGETPANWYDIDLLNAESFADGNIRELLTLDTDTGQPSGSTTGWQTNLTDITGLFESINGEVFDRTDSTWAAGAWQPAGSGTGGVAGYPTEDLPEPTTTSYLGLSAGGSYIVLQT